jgi:hypothetical protein
MTSLMKVLCLSVMVFAGARGEAAVIDVDYPAIADTPVGKALKAVLYKDGTVDGDPACSVNRVLVSWEGERSPPLLQYRGLQATHLREALSQQATSVETKAGTAVEMPNQPRFAMLQVSDDEVAVATLNGLNNLALKEWPEPSGNLITFTGVPSDLKLDDPDWNKKITTFTLTFSASGKLNLRAFALNSSEAQSVMRWVSGSRPALAIAAGLGIEKAQFPQRLVKDAKIQRRGSIITVDVDLSKDETLLKDTYQFLTDTLSKRMRKYSKPQAQPAAPKE